MKKVHVLAGIAGLMPTAIGMAIPSAAHADTARQMELVLPSGKTVVMHPITGKVAGLPVCQGRISGWRSSHVGIDVCHGNNINNHWSYVYWTNESVYYTGTYGRTWRLHVDNVVTQTYYLYAGAGWHQHAYGNGRTVTSVCVGASHTPGYPCWTL